MTRTLPALLMVLLLAPSPAHADELTLRDVIELHRSGLGDDLLIAVIDADGGPFRLGFADIQDLKSDGLSERVIAALVRTGTRRPIGEDGGPPVVQVTQEVNNVIVPAFVVMDTRSSGEQDRRRDDRHGPAPRRPGQDRDSETATPPPATWVTRQQDGKNVSATGAVRTAAPAATWVTPRDPKPSDTPPENGPPRR